VELQTVIGELYLVDGVVQEAKPAPGLLIQQAPKGVARGREGDSLFVHLTLTGQPSEYGELANALLGTIRSRYYQTTGSVTAALRRAIIDANEYLLRANMNSRGASRLGAVTCAVLRRQELFVVQAGEAFALIARNFGVERIPDKEPERLVPLGLTAGTDLRYFHNWLEAGDMLLLADPSLANIPNEMAQSVLVDSTVEESLPVLKQIVGQRTARMLLMEFVDDAPYVVDIPDVVGVPATGQAQSVSGNKARVVGGAAVAAAAGSNRSVRQRDVRAARPEPASAPQPRVASPQTSLPSREEVSATARQASSRAVLGLSFLTGWVADLMGRLRPARDHEASQAGAAGWAVPTLIAILIPVFVGIIVTSVYVQRGRVQRMSEIKRDMGLAIGLAEQSSDESEQRRLYNQVLVLAAEAELLRPDDPDIQILRETALIELDLVDAVTRLLGQRLYSYPTGTELDSVVLREGFNGDIYTLDKAGNQVLRHETSEDYLTLTTEGPSVVLFNAQAVGNHVTGRLIDLMWRPSGVEVSQSGLAILDGAGALTTYVPGIERLSAVRLGLASEWQSPVALTQFSERIYILDPSAGVIWRYFAEGDGFYVEEDQRTITLPDLEQAVDIAIYSEDGSVIVLYADGRLRRYVEGNVLWDENTLIETGLTDGLVAPTRVKVIGRGLNSSIFVADPGSSRIIQLSLGGTLLAQYKAIDLETNQELFTGMRDFDVAEAPLRIFVVTRDGLFVAMQN
jgi:hypothetical protein